MTDWGNELEALLGGIGRTVRGAVRTVRSVVSNDPFEVLAYRGYGNATRAWIYGRALEKREVSLSTDTDSSLRNLLNTYRRADSDPLQFARVAVEFAGGKTELKADDEGFFGGWLSPAEPVVDGKEWHEYSVELLSPLRAASDKVNSSGEILIPPPSARFGVISDIDDTVIQSSVSHFLQAARTVMLGNARTRLPFPGVAAFYEALRNGAEGNEKNPIFYVSSSPWNFYDVIAEFLDLQKIPKGPLILRDWDMGLDLLSSSRHVDHKGVAIRNIIQLYPALPFILIGDTSQHDPEIYRRIVEEFPNRIKAIYIRDVTLSADRSASVKKLADEILAAKSVLVLAEDTLGASRHAAGQGWIAGEALPKVKEEKRADEGKDGAKVAAPGGGKPSSGEEPKVIGEPST